MLNVQQGMLQREVPDLKANLHGLYCVVVRVHVVEGWIVLGREANQVGVLVFLPLGRC